MKAKNEFINLIKERNRITRMQVLAINSGNMKEAEACREKIKKIDKRRVFLSSHQSTNKK